MNKEETEEEASSRPLLVRESNEGLVVSRASSMSIASEYEDVKSDNESDFEVINASDTADNSTAETPRAGSVVDEVEAVPTGTVVIYEQSQEATSAVAKLHREHNEKVLDSLEPGDLIEYKRKLYSHWAVYVGHGKIIHLNGDVNVNNVLSVSGVSMSSVFSSARVVIDTYWSIMHESRAYKNNSKDSDMRPLPSNEILMRAYGRVGQEFYNLISFNCEHFANSCRYDLHISDQVVSLLRAGNFITKRLRIAQNGLRELKNKIANKNQQQNIETLTPSTN